ncbi:MAG: DUF1343 domain-containing protein, partial [Rhodothermales bacterium]|nr:DUF1343 domain-containing protein [Rhodothermales bacterium]
MRRMRAAYGIALLALAACFAGAGCAPSEDDSPVDTRADAVLTGADVLVRDGFRQLDGLSIGLIANHTAVSGGRHLADLIHEAPNVELAALFGPEHGLRGQAAAGEQVADGIDDATGAPVYSLYGDTRRPTPEMLEGVDALVFDIQDVGARFYTYISTMGLAMQSATENGIPFYVLDRPNPLGGEVMEGFVLDTTHTSFVGLYPIPQRHGMTVGEIAGMIRGQAWLPAVDSVELHVVPMSGWTRSTLWPETGLDWLPPSPNLPSFESALVYPGTALFEATTASEGRGTPSPFLTVGAPWLPADSVLARLPVESIEGLRLVAGRATPVELPGKAVNPKFEGQPMEAIVIEVRSPGSVRAVEFGIDLVRTVYESAPDSVRQAFFNERWLTLLSGTDRLLG